MKEQKKLLKGRLLTALSRHLVINQETLKNYDMLYKEEQKIKLLGINKIGLYQVQIQFIIIFI